MFRAHIQNSAFYHLPGIALAVLLLGNSASAQNAVPPVSNSSTPGHAQSIQEIIEGVIEQQQLVGTQAAIWHEGELVFEQAWGQASVALDVPVTDKTRFLIASITKTMTASAVRALADEGLLDLDEPIQTYVPEFPAKPGPPVTARLLLEHRGGIRHYWQGETAGAGFFDQHYETALAAVSKFADDDLTSPPGERMAYSSFGYTLLAAAVEKVSGDNFADHLRKTIFEKQGMNNTEAPDWRYPVTQLATSYAYFLPHLAQAEEKPFEARRLNFSYNAGGGNLVSNCQDLIVYGRAFLPGGDFGDEVANQVINATPRPASWSGWSVAEDNNNRIVLHATGASEAYQGSITIWPEHELVVVALSNTWGLNSRAGGFTLPMHREIADVVLSQ